MSEKKTTNKNIEKPSNIVPLFPFIKTSNKTTDIRALSFDNRKQRNAKMIQKGMSKPGQVSFDTLRRVAVSVPIVRICITVLKEKITKTKWQIKSIDPLKQPDEAQLKKLEEIFKHPNKNDETFRTLLDKMLEDLLVIDSVSIEKTRYPSGELAELHFVDSATIRPVFNEKGQQDPKIPLQTKDGTKDLPVSYIQVMDNSQYGGPESGEIVAAWPKHDFIHFHMHPQGAMENFGYGLSPIEGILSVIANLLNADNYNGTYFEEGSFPPTLLNFKGQMTQADLEAAREYIYSEMNGSFHRPAMTAGGEVEVIKIKDNNNSDMQFMEYTEFLARLCAAAYGLSGQDIGLVDDLNRATSQTQQNLSEEKGYGSILHLVKEVFNQEIIWKDFGFTELEFDWVVDDTMDPTVMSTVTDAALKNGTMTINEARKKRGDLPYEGEWANEPMILTGNGYVKMTPESANKGDTDEEGMVGNEKNYKDETVNKSINTIDGYKTWMDDRGYSQPFICFNILSGRGMVVKPPVAVNLMSQNLEIELSNVLCGKGLNAPLIRKVTYDEVCNMLPSDSIRVEFGRYINMTPEYDSEKWRARQGGSRKFDYYLLSDYINGFSLDNALVLKDMARDPDSYTQAIKDLAQLWIVEKELVLGDRRVNQYIMTPDKRVYGVDYQFKGDEGRWKDSSQAIADLLKDIPDLYNLFMKEIGESSVSKSANVEQPLVVADSSNAFKDIPTMFGELVGDDKLKTYIQSMFLLQNDQTLVLNGLSEMSSSYDYNQALKTLKTFVDANVYGYGGILTIKDVAGIKYSVYIHK